MATRPMSIQELEAKADRDDGRHPRHVRGGEQGGAAADTVPGQRGPPAVHADLPLAQPNPDAHLERGPQVRGEPRVAGQRAALAVRGGDDETP
mgnify:CR=1 FL=1